MLIACNDDVGVLRIEFVGPMYVERGMESWYVEDDVFGS